MKQLSPFKLRVLKAWENSLWGSVREIAIALNANESVVHTAMIFIRENGWTKPVYGFDYGVKIVAPKGWEILPDGMDIPNVHREFLHDIGWAEPRRCRGTMTPPRAMVWGGVRAVAVPEVEHEALQGQKLHRKSKTKVYGLERWKVYQTDSSRTNGVKRVSDLTEAEAKDELCDAMDLIEELRQLQTAMQLVIEEAKYG